MLPESRFELKFGESEVNEIQESERKKRMRRKQEERVREGGGGEGACKNVEKTRHTTVSTCIYHGMLKYIQNIINHPK